MDDNGTQYSIGQQFVIANSQQCFCGIGGNISCDHEAADLESSRSNNYALK